MPPSLVVLFDSEEPRTLSTAQFGHDNFLVCFPAETVQKLTQRPDLCEKPVWLDVCVHDDGLLASELSTRGFPATVVRRGRGVAFSYPGQDLLRPSNPF